MNAMDASQSANFLCDIVFGGNQFLYDMISMVTDVVFDVVSRKALMNAAKGGKLISKFQQVKGKTSKFWDGICKKTKVAGTLLGGQPSEPMWMW